MSGYQEFKRVIKSQGQSISSSMHEQTLAAEQQLQTIRLILIRHLANAVMSTH